ncbi:MAG: hypothetical protein ETSY2_41910 [Candidatus Entotheonella gemina]|uniref:Uncharacterized protein n=1 Tax=Candidatus Entotheonella gemina TaxID=1429439 RepID=W4LNH4_9BACT|nr:MAG: hypothetical protein ETSY2_41910 [Candidatus Entotheonella gemina]
MRIIFMGYRIPKIYQQAIAKVLGNVALKALNDVRAGRLIRTNHVAIDFGIELGRQLGGAHQITEHHGELTTFGFRNRWPAWRSLGLNLGLRLWLHGASGGQVVSAGVTKSASWWVDMVTCRTGPIQLSATGITKSRAVWILMLTLETLHIDLQRRSSST